MRVALLVVLLVSVAACSNAVDGAASAAAQAPVPGAGVKVVLSDKPLPLPVFTLTDLNGQRIDQQAWKGKVVLLNFWATWCGPCRAEIPDLIALQNKYKDQLVVVGLSVDEGSADLVKQFVTDHQINYPVAIVKDDVQDLFGGVSAIPSTFVLDTDGRIVQRHVGLLKADVTEQEVRALAKLPTAAEVTVVKDTGQVLSANAAYATEIPGVDFAALTPPQKAAALKRLNEDKCTCGCGRTLAVCRIDDPTCETSLPLSLRVVEEIRRKK